MKVSQAISYTKNTTLQNLAADWATDDYWLFVLNQALVFMYCYIASHWSRYWANYEETISPDVDTNNIFSTTYGIWKIWEAQNPTSGTAIYEAQISPNMQDSRAWSDEDIKWLKRVNSSSKKVQTVDDMDSLFIIYSRMPKWHEFENRTQEDLDIPDELMAALQITINRLITPIHLEQWFSLSNAYLAQAKALIDEYCSATNTKSTGFTA